MKFMADINKFLTNPAALRQTAAAISNFANGQQKGKGLLPSKATLKKIAKAAGVSLAAAGAVAAALMGHEHAPEIQRALEDARIASVPARMTAKRALGKVSDVLATAGAPSGVAKGIASLHARVGPTYNDWLENTLRRAKARLDRATTTINEDGECM